MTSKQALRIITKTRNNKIKTEKLNQSTIMYVVIEILKKDFKVLLKLNK